MIDESATLARPRVRDERRALRPLFPRASRRVFVLEMYHMVATAARESVIKALGR